MTKPLSGATPPTSLTRRELSLGSNREHSHEGINSPQKELQRLNGFIESMVLSPLISVYFNSGLRLSGAITVPGRIN